MPLGVLYLIPVTLGNDEVQRTIPEYNSALVKNITHFIAENAKSARQFLKLCNYPDLSGTNIEELNNHTDPAELPEFIKPLLNGQDMGLMSDAGCPGVADPGAAIVKLAHRHRIQVVPLVGPSSIILSIMASGFSGQNFAFNGYLPIEKPQRHKRLKELEQLALKSGQSQFFIETPYRNINLFSDVLSVLHPDTQLSIAADLTLPSEFNVSQPVSQWRKSSAPDINKRPAVFGISK